MKQSFTLQGSKVNRIIRVVFDADMRNQHDGLAQIAKGLGIEVKTLKVGEFVVFINTKQNLLKLYTCNNTIAYLKLNSGRINLNVLASIPMFFNGTEIKYNDALKATLSKQLRS